MKARRNLVRRERGHAKGRAAPDKARAGIWRRPSWFLFVVCFVSLYWEILLIRWLPSELPLLGYFKSLVILATFLGMGMGCLAAGRFRSSSGVLTASFLVGVCVIVYTVLIGGDRLKSRGFGSASGILQQDKTEKTQPEAEFTIEFRGSEAGGTVVIVVAFVGVTLLFLPLGAIIARYFDLLPPLWAYSVNLTGSLLGTLLFVVFSLAGFGPLVWFSIGTAASLPLFLSDPSLRKGPAVWLSAGAVLAVLAVVGIGLAPRENVLWSPYQRVSWGIAQGYDATHETTRTLCAPIYVNYEYHQAIVNMALAETPEKQLALCRQMDRLCKGTYDSFEGFFRRYETPYSIVKSPRRVLVVAAGNGNETAAALRHGAQEVDAVEIDPGIIEIGRRFHPEAPYTSPRVNVVADDARGFVQRTHKRYDLIVMNAVDSHSQFATCAGLRLDSYIFTQGFFEQIQRLLADNGVFVMEFSGYHWFKVPWCKERLLEMLWRAFGYRPPADKDVQTGAGGPILTIRRGTPPPPSAWNREIAISTDDWPQFFVKGHFIPSAYRRLIAAVLILCGVFLFAFLPRGKRKPDLHFAFLGAAFMMLEIKSITELSLAFGATWFVSSMVIAAILLAIGVANLVVLLSRRGSYWLGYGILFLGLLAAALFPPKSFLALGFGARAAIACLRVAIPVFGAGLVFPHSFRRARVPSTALGWNLVGAMIGGLGEYLSMVFSVSALGYFIIALYAASLLSLRFTRFKT